MNNYRTRSSLFLFASMALIGGTVSSPLYRQVVGAEENESTDRPVPYRTLHAHRGTVVQTVFSPNGKILATASTLNDCKIKLWEVESRKLLHEFPVTNLSPYEIIFSPDSRLLADMDSNIDKAGRPIEVRIWEIATGKLIAKFNPHLCNTIGLAFSSDSRLLAVATCDDFVKIWDVSAEKWLPSKRGWPHPKDSPKRTYASVLETEISHLAFSPDGKQLFAIDDAEGGGAISIYDAETGKKRVELTDYKGRMFLLKLSQDGRRLTSIHKDGKIRVWDTQTGKKMSTAETRRIPDTYYRGARISSDGRLAITNDGEMISIWGFDAKKERIAYFRRRSIQETLFFSATAIGFSSDGRLLATAISDDTVEIWELKMLLKHGVCPGKTP